MHKVLFQSLMLQTNPIKKPQLTRHMLLTFNKSNNHIGKETPVLVRVLQRNKTDKIYLCMYVCMCVYVCMYICVNVYMYVYMSVC